MTTDNRKPITEEDVAKLQQIKDAEIAKVTKERDEARATAAKAADQKDLEGRYKDLDGDALAKERAALAAEKAALAEQQNSFLLQREATANGLTVDELKERLGQSPPSNPGDITRIAHDMGRDKKLDGLEKKVAELETTAGTTSRRPSGGGGGAVDDRSGLSPEQLLAKSLSERGGLSGIAVDGRSKG